MNQIPFTFACENHKYHPEAAPFCGLAFIDIHRTLPNLQLCFNCE